jgi:ribosome recycling factor
MKLNQIANIQLMDARTVLIKPYDRSCIKDINTAITNSNMGVSPQTNPDSIKIVFPAQTEENRKLNVKKAKEYLEQEKIKIKNIRQAVKKTIDALTGISEDIIKNFNESLDKYTKKINLEVETIFNNKQVELMKL